MKKKVLFVLSLILILGSCSGNAKDQNDSNDEQETSEVSMSDETIGEKVATSDPFPWDFPETIPLNLEIGQYVLAPYSFYPKALEESKDLTKETLIFYSKKLEKIGEKASVISKQTIPNSLIIPIPTGQKAKNGDIVLTWWQGGSGMQRAIVTDASDSAEPKVDFLDLNYSDNPEKPESANKFSNTKLKPNSFVVLKDGEWQSGMPVAVRNNRKWDAGRLIHVSGDRALVLKSGSKVVGVAKDDCILIPLKPNFQPGENVYSLFVYSFEPDFEVIKHDKKTGRVWVKKQGKDEIKIVNQFEVLKNLD